MGEVGERVGGLAALGAAGGAGGQVAQQRTRAGYGSLPRGKEKKEEAGSAGTEGGFRGRAVVYPRVRERNGVGTFSRVMGLGRLAALWGGGVLLLGGVAVAVAEVG